MAIELSDLESLVANNTETTRSVISGIGWSSMQSLTNEALSEIDSGLRHELLVLAVEAKKICDMGHIYDTTCQIHVCGGPIMTAAALQLECAISNFAIHELHRYALLEGNRVTCKYDYLPVNGKYQIPDLPGIGQELTDKSIAESPKETVK